MDEWDQQQDEANEVQQQESALRKNNSNQKVSNKKSHRIPWIIGGTVIVVAIIAIVANLGGTNLSGTWSVNESNGSGVGNGSGTSTLIVSQGGNGVLSGQFVPSGDTADTMPISGNFDASTNKFVFSGPLDAESFSGTYQNGELVGINSSAAGVQSSFTATK